ncbi:hypothetical protein Avbf_17983, partial [Armadillidium vulgare]
RVLFFKSFIPKKYSPLKISYFNIIKIKELKENEQINSVMIKHMKKYLKIIQLRKEKNKEELEHFHEYLSSTI